MTLLITTPTSKLRLLSTASMKRRWIATSFFFLKDYCYEFPKVEKRKQVPIFARHEAMVGHPGRGGVQRVNGWVAKEGWWVETLLSKKICGRTCAKT